MSERTRSLVRAWLALMALSLALAVAADVRALSSQLPPLALIAIGAVVVLKARLILRDYLELRASPGFLSALLAMVVLTLTVVIAAFMLARG